MNAYTSALKTTHGLSIELAPFRKIAGGIGGSPAARPPAPVPAPAPRRRRAAPPPAATSPAKPLRYELRSTVSYRVNGRALSGTIVGIAHDDPLRYDIRILHGAGGKRRPVYRVSFAVPHGDIEKLLTPPPEGERILVLSDLPPEPPAPVGQKILQPGPRKFLAQLWKVERQ